MFDFIHNDKNEAQLVGQSETFVLDFHELYDHNEYEARSLIDSPEYWVQVLKEVYLAPSSPEGKHWSVKIRNLVEPTKIRAIKSEHINKLLQEEAIVVTTAIPEATITTAIYECDVCHEQIEIKQLGFEMERPTKCPMPGCSNRRSFKLLPEKCVYIDTQLIRLQERPEELPPGEIPEPLTTLLRGNLIRYASPGDRVKIVGILKVKPTKRGSLDFSKLLEANSVEVLNRNHIDTILSKERIQQIMALSQQPDLEEILINSYCPSIYGWRHVKKGFLRNLFGGVRKDKEGSIVRGDIHMLLTGDPGLGKTIMMLFGKDVAQRGVYDTGRGVTGVGLTAALIKIDDKFALAAGTLPLADMGNCYLDEFEKMNKEDREMIHVPMDTGIVTVSKGGLRTTLNSRCGVVAAMNPVDGRYNTYKTLVDNLRRKPEDFPDSLIGRFDLIFIMVDKIEKELDKAIAERMLRLDKRDTKSKIPADLLKDYIAYSKKITPTICEELREKIKEYYEQKRQEMRNDLKKVFTPRQLESIERLVESRARMHLRTEATMEDLEDSLWLHEIYINETWKDPYTNEVDTGPMMGILETSRMKQAEFIPRIVEQMYRDGKGQRGVDAELYVRRGDLVDELVASGKVDQGRANDIIKVAMEKDLVWSPGVDRIKLSGTGANRMLGAEDAG